MKRKSRKRAPSKTRTTCADLTQDGAQTIAVTVKQAMYSQGYPGRPPETVIDVPGFRIYGTDAVALSEITGIPFAPPQPLGKRAAARRSRKKK
jgi:hypothetical protein